MQRKIFNIVLECAQVVIFNFEIVLAIDEAVAITIGVALNVVDGRFVELGELDGGELFVVDLRVHSCSRLPSVRLDVGVERAMQAFGDVKIFPE